VCVTTGKLALVARVPYLVDSQHLAARCAVAFGLGKYFTKCVAFVTFDMYVFARSEMERNCMFSYAVAELLLGKYCFFCVYVETARFRQ